ncbi:unnamed protein product [Parnassius apollo]|uniref:(apollo) hypothetical protein n=1 Tax=Parnassius apollo TaxID=110799 RepID=A0A8S3XBW3_PARAO|nr:unnamed protein product [Parnassius apollo]
MTELAPTSTLTPSKRGRKKHINEKGWKRNIAKRLRISRKEYQTSKRRRTSSERHLKEPCKDTCKFKFGTNITESQQLQLNEDYWTLGSIQKTMEFYCKFCERCYAITSFY